MAKSIKGREVNLAALAAQHSKTVALGNSNKNVRGDIVTKAGKVLKTREELANEYHTRGKNQVHTVAISDDINKMLEPIQSNTQNPQHKKKPIVPTTSTK